MMQVKKLPVQTLKYKRINSMPFEDAVAEPEPDFNDAILDTNRVFNAIRNTQVRGYHMDNGTDLQDKKIMSSMKKRKEMSMMQRISEKDALEGGKLDKDRNRGNKQLDERQKGITEVLMFNPYEDFQARGEEGVISGISTEQQDDYLPNMRDAFQKVSIVEPYSVAKKLGGMKLKKMKK